MPFLSRNSSRLLHQVDHKQHATQEDHQDPLKQYLTPPSSNNTSNEGLKRKREETEEEIYADPESSDDESATVLKPHNSVLPLNPPEDRAGFQHKPPVPDVDGPADVKSKAASAFQQPKSSSVDSAGRRTADDEAAQLSSDEGGIFQEAKRRRTGPKVPGKPYEKQPSTISNIHAQPKSNQPLRGKKTSYGGKEVQRKQFTNRSMPTMSATKHEQPSTPPQETPIPKARHLNKHHHHPLSPPSAQRPTAPTSLPPNLSTTPHHPQASPAHAPNSSLSSSTKASQTSTPNPAHSPTNGNNASAARETWHARGYPARISWEDLPRRMSEPRHIRHVKQVMKGQRESVFRKRLEGRVLRKGGAETALQALAAEEEAEEKGGVEGKEMTARKGCKVGYYGPRGEKMMTTHILHTFTPDLRSLAATDKLLASAGIAGGVSGFVQAVLVPELALSLVSEDLEKAASHDQKKKGSSPATIATMNLVEVLEESAELGELLNPEISVSEERSAGLRRRRVSEDQDEQEDEGGVG
ncbi:hypothetical protein D0863_09513 [Hortaea werneckii]|uniref:Restriction of telomere capping protein 4 n=1 Tax=Hortaea werneckii TaxID=91943 RepID=A0A3M7DKU1_HORWE|nr:hypothetical protein D0863_09513 [Hortaea werneckii]